MDHRSRREGVLNSAGVGKLNRVIEAFTHSIANVNSHFEHKKCHFTTSIYYNLTSAFIDINIEYILLTPCKINIIHLSF